MYSTTKDELKQSASHIKDAARDTAGDIREDLRDTANRAGRKVRGFIDTTADEFSNVAGNVNSQIHEKPLQASLIALGLGFVLGALFRR